MGDRADVDAGAAARAPVTEADRPTPPWRGALAVVGFSLAPFADFLLANRLQGVTAWQLAPYAAAVLAIGAAVLAVVWRLRGAVAADRGAMAYAGGLFVTFNFGALSGGLDRLGLAVGAQQLVWVALLLAVLAGAVLIARSRAARSWVAAFGVLLVALPALQLAVADGASSAAPADDEPPPASADDGPTTGTLTSRPDIYYIVPDGYGRADLLADDHGLDNSAFLRFLEAEGFTVDDEAFSNATTTFVSVSSTLAMDYLVEPGPEALPADASGRIDRRPFYEVIQGDSAVVQHLRAQGYVHVQAPPGTWSGSECSGSEDVCIDPLPVGEARFTLDEVEWGLLRMTPVAGVLTGLGETFDGVAADPLHTLQQVADVDEPVFAFVHMLHPHPPFQFDERCNPLPADRALEQWHDVAKPAYVAGVRCTNRRLRAFVEALPPEAIVVLQADHGPDFRRSAVTPVDRWSEEQVVERLSILSAIRLPETCRDLTERSFTGVNAFRVVLACLEGRDAELLPDRQLLVPYEGTEVVEVDPDRLGAADANAQR